MHLGLVYIVDNLAIQLSGWYLTKFPSLRERQARSQGLCQNRWADGSLYRQNLTVAKETFKTTNPQHTNQAVFDAKIPGVLDRSGLQTTQVNLFSHATIWLVDLKVEFSCS